MNSQATRSFIAGRPATARSGVCALGQRCCALVVLCVAAHPATHLPAGAMDDETHWVWDEALSAIEFTNA